MAKKKEKLKDIIPFTNHSSNLFRMIKYEKIKDYKPTNEILKSSVWYDVINQFNNNIISIFKLTFIIEYFNIVFNFMYEQDWNFKRKLEYNGLFSDKNIKLFFNDLKNIIFFLEYRYLRKLELDFRESCDDFPNNPLNEPNYIFNFDIMAYESLFIEIGNMLEMNWYNFNEDKIIKKELLLFWICYEQDEVINYWTKYIVSFEELKLEEKYFIEKKLVFGSDKNIKKEESKKTESNELIKKDLVKVDWYKNHFKVILNKVKEVEENYVKENYVKENKIDYSTALKQKLNPMKLPQQFSFKTHHVIIKERDIITFIPFINFNKNQNFLNWTYFNDNKLAFWDIPWSFFEYGKNNSEIERFEEVKNFFQKNWENYSFKSEYNIKTMYDIEDLIENEITKIKSKYYKDSDVLDYKEEKKYLKEISKFSYLFSVFRKFDLKYSFILSWKPYWDWLFPQVWATYSLLVRYIKQVQDKINWLWINFKDKIFFEIWWQQLNFETFKEETLDELENYKQEKSKIIINDVLGSSTILFNYFDSISSSEVIDYKDVFKKIIKLDTKKSPSS